MSTLAEYQPQSVKGETVLPRAVLVWLGTTSGGWIVVATIVGAPVLLAGGHTELSRIIYQVYSRLCHQIPNRSYFLNGHPFAVCARCTGLYVGFAIGATCYPLFRSLKNITTPPRALLFIAIVPIVVDFSLGFLGLWNNTHTSRFITGAILSIVSAFYIVPGLIELFITGFRIWPSNKVPDTPVSGNVTTLDQSSIKAAASDYRTPWRRI